VTKFLLLELNPKTLYHIHNILPLNPKLGQMNPIHTLTVYCFKVRLLIVSKYGSRKDGEQKVVLWILI
jgi:hypothetical protein